MSVLDSGSAAASTRAVTVATRTNVGSARSRRKPDGRRGAGRSSPVTVRSPGLTLTWHTFLAQPGVSGRHPGGNRHFVTTSACTAVLEPLIVEAPTYTTLILCLPLFSTGSRIVLEPLFLPLRLVVSRTFLLPS